MIGSRNVKVKPHVLVLAVAAFFFLVYTTIYGFHVPTKRPQQPPTSPSNDNKEGFTRPSYVSANSVTGQSESKRHAYAIFLSGTVAGKEEDFENDVYFIGTRILVWQLLHDPDTRSEGIDVVVLATPDVNVARLERLRKDGATIRQVELVRGKHDEWVVPKLERWNGIMSKLRAWEMEEYASILMLDGDMVLQHPLDGIFKDPGAQTMQTLPDVPRKDDEPELPTEYMISGIGEIKNENHDFPPKGWEAGDDSDLKKPGYFNAGFFLLKPNKKLFDYYVALLDIKDRFDPKYMEQNLLNYAHRWDGPMPWREIAYTWNIRCVTDKDLEGNVTSMHQKWWEEPESKSRDVRDLLLRKRWQMEGYYQGRA